MSSLHLLPKSSILTPLSLPVPKKIPKYLHLLGSRRLLSQTGNVPGTFEDDGRPFWMADLSDTATLPPQTEITTTGRDYPGVKSPFKIKSLAIEAAHGKGSGRSRASWACGAGLTECPEQ